MWSKCCILGQLLFNFLTSMNCGVSLLRAFVVAFYKAFVLFVNLGTVWKVFKLRFFFNPFSLFNSYCLYTWRKTMVFFRVLRLNLEVEKRQCLTFCKYHWWRRALELLFPHLGKKCFGKYEKWQFSVSAVGKKIQFIELF